jgi:ferredoxin-NADP reductase
MSTSASAHTAPLIKREEIAEGTMAFHFAKPADFQFRAGRSMDLTLLNAPETDAEGNSRVFSIATEMDKSHREWKGETGFINKDMLTKHLSSLQGPIYYFGGPPAMVAAMRSMLIEAGMDEDDIRAEEFSGY